MQCIDEYARKAALGNRFQNSKVTELWYTEFLFVVRLTCVQQECVSIRMAARNVKPPLGPIVFTEARISRSGNHAEVTTEMDNKYPGTSPGGKPRWRGHSVESGRDTASLRRDERKKARDRRE